MFTMELTVVTHNGQFHADEITAIALLKSFYPEHIFKIKRIPHQAEIPENAYFVIDIGRKYDGQKFFDHHQWKHGKSSAGLIWDYINIQKQYPKLSEFIDLVDQHDVGLRKATQFEYPSLIAAYNSDKIYNDEEQMKCFNKALDFAVTVITSMKKYQDALDETERTLLTYINNRSEWEIANNVLILPGYLKGWNLFINGQMSPDIKVITWPKEDSEEWQAQVPAETPGSYELIGDKFKQDESMTFVHASGFFCVAPNKQTMLNYIEKHTVNS